MVTGAGQGIVYAIAKEFLNHGLNVIIVDINNDKWNVSQNSEKIFLKKFDLTKRD